MAYYIKTNIEEREAKELTELNRDEVMEWCNGKKGPDGSIFLKTPESHGETQLAYTGDFIMKAYSDDLGWHFYPIKPDYFNNNYKKVRD
jgi:hypothetical protein